MTGDQTPGAADAVSVERRAALLEEYVAGRVGFGRWWDALSRAERDALNADLTAAAGAWARLMRQPDMSAAVAVELLRQWRYQARGGADDGG